MQEALIPRFSHVIKGSVLYGSADIVVALVRFSLMALYTRILSPAEFGFYAVLTTSLMLANVFIPLGIPSAIMIKLGEKKTENRLPEKDSAFFFLVFTCIFCGMVFNGIAQFGSLKSSLSGLTYWLILYISSDILSAIPKVSLRLHGNITGFNTAKIIRVSAMAVILIIVVKGGKNGISAIIIAESAATFLEFIVCMIFDKFLPYRFSFSHLKPLLHTGVPLTIVAFGVVSIDVSDRYVISSILGNGANGFYAAAAKIVVAASFFAEAFNGMWFPYFLKITSKSNFKIDEDMRRFGKRLIVAFAVAISFLIIALPMLVSLKIAGKEFVAKQYHEVAVLIGPLTLAYFFKIVFYLSSAALIAQKRSWTLCAIIYVAAAVNIGGNILTANARGSHDIFLTLSIIALMTSVAYAIGMIGAAKASGMFAFRFWFISPTIWLSIGCLTLAFLPIPVFAKIACLAVFSILFGLKILSVKKA